MQYFLIILVGLCFHLNADTEMQDKITLDPTYETLIAGKTESDLEAAIVNIDQAGIINKMIRYLEINQRDTAVINKGGVCNGLAFLAQYYNSLGMLDEFFIALESMAAWNETKASLKMPTRIPYQYSTLSDLFDQWINDISWFQQTYVEIAVLPSYEISHQRRRIQQYEMIKRSDEYREIALLSSPINYSALTKAQLAELLEIWSWYPNTIVEFGGSRHATSSTVLSDGSIFYYDPNIPTRLRPYDSYQDLAYLIQETKYKLLGMPHEKMNIEIMAYQYVQKGLDPYIPTAIPAIRQWKTGNQSPNRFTPLHIAIYANDFDYFRFLLQQPGTNPNQTDSMGVSPLYLATQMWKTDFVHELLKHPKLNIHATTRLSPIMGAVANYNLDVAEMLINEGADLFITADEKLNLDQILQQDTTAKAFKIPAIAICFMKQDELDFVRKLCQRVPHLTQLRDASGKTLLDYAVMLENYALYEILLNADEF